MSKYSFEFKMKVVKEYLTGAGGMFFLSKKYGIAHKSSIQVWIAAYNKFSANGLKKTHKNKNYSLNFKIKVVELYIVTKTSYQELALKVGMNEPSLIKGWVNNFRLAGPIH